MKIIHGVIYILLGPDHIHCCHSGRQKEIYICKKAVISDCIKQVSDRNWTKIRMPKVIDVDYNTVGPLLSTK